MLVIQLSTMSEEWAFYVSNDVMFWSLRTEFFNKLLV